MGKAARWLKALLTGRKPPPDDRKPAKEKKKWGFGKSDRERRPEVVVGMEERKGPYREVGCVSAEEENKRAIAMAAATAAVAEAAVAAAQAAAVVVRLTSSGRGVVGVKREQLAAVKIQAAFRGYLARRALKALKGLVKLQALVRGNIVRKQAAETLRCMQALVRVQARARACRALRSEKGQKLHSKGSSGAHSLPGPPTPEKFEPPIRQSSSSGSVKKNSNPANSEKVEQDKMQYAPWNWLDRWMEERYWDSRDAIAKSTAIAMTEDDRSTKILEIDTGRQHHHHNGKRRSSYQPHSSCSTLTSEQNTCSISNLPASPSKDSTAAHLSIPSPPSVDMQQSLSPLRFHPVEARDYGDSPQFYSAKSRHGSSRRGPFTPAKSECSRSLFSGYFDYPNYMAGTESSRAKARSQSAPKQRPEFEKSGSMKRLSAIHQGFMQQNSSVSTQKSLSLQAKFANKAYPGSGRLDRLGMPMRM